MTDTVHLQGSIQFVGELLDFTAIIILLIYVYYYIEYKRGSSSQVKSKARRRATLSLLGFVTYAVFISFFGPSNTFVAPIGRQLEQYLQDFAQSIVLTGVEDAPQNQPTFLNRASRTLKFIGLVTYVILLGAISASNAVIAKLTQTIRGIFQ